jgi:hypothetical protein
MKIIDVVKLSDEIIHSKGRIEGWDSLRGIFEGRKESDPNYVFRTTYPTDEIKNLLKAIEEKLGGKRATGLFEILGGYGTGKSRILVLLWHLFKNNELAIEWAKRHGIDLNLPKDVKLLAFNLLDENPVYLWEPIFKRLGREDLLKTIKDFPSYNLLKEALSNKGIVIILIDELEAWYMGKEDKAKNLNFIQILAEAACEEGGKLLVFCSLYGEDKELLARIERVNTYRVNLTLSKDRPKIVLHRLFDKIELKQASEIVKDYIKHYADSEVGVGNQPAYETKMIEFYPVHPELMEVLLTRFSSSPNYQNTRGVLGLLGSVVYKKAKEVDLILASDVDMSEEELLTLDRMLTENAIKDADSIRKEEVRKLLNVILLYSFGDGKGIGASRNDVILGVLRPGININDVEPLLENLPNIAPHVWLKDEDKYIIGREANVITIIQNKASENIGRGDIDGALSIIKEMLMKDQSYIIYHPVKEYSDLIEDKDRLRVVVSLKALEQSEINEFYKGKEYVNRLILYIPKGGDITRNKDLLVIAERIRLCDQYEKEISGENKRLLASQKDKDIKHLEEKLSDIYGYWVRITGFENDEVKYRLIQCSIGEVKSTVKKSYDVETIRDEIVKHLESKGAGLSVKDLTYDFKIRPGKPIIVAENILEEALKSLYNEGKIVVNYKGKSCRTPGPMPPIKDETQIILTKYAPPQPPSQLEIEEEKEKKKTKTIEEETLEKFKSPETVETLTRKERVEVPPQVIETSEYQTPFRLSEEIERRIPEGAKIQQIKIDLSKLSFDNVDAFTSLITIFSFKKPKISIVNMQVTLEGPMDKNDVIKLIEKLPASLYGGAVRASIELRENA